MYKVRFLRNFMHFNALKNFILCIFELFIVIYQKEFTFDTYTDEESSFLINLMLSDFFVLVITLLFRPPSVKINEDFYLKNQSKYVKYKKKLFLNSYFYFLCRIISLYMK